MAVQSRRTGRSALPSGVVLAGDWAQLSAVDAGGAFHLLANEPGACVVELGEIRRFTHPWEASASRQLRDGDPAAIHAYQQHDRIVGGERNQLVDGLYRAWKADIETGHASLMIAGDTETVDQLNRRAQADRIAAGQVDGSGITSGDGQTFGVGDWVVTRHNDRHLTDGHAWVQNGDRWTVTATNPDGTVTVQRANSHRQVTLPQDYVESHLDLGYAISTHRSQGRTVDTTHTLVDNSTTREGLYVAVTRGRQDNHLYVDTVYDPDPGTSHGQPHEAATEAVLAAVLANTGAESSAHHTMRAKQRDAETWATLAAEYHTLASAAQAPRWDALLAQSGLTNQQLRTVTDSNPHGSVHTALRTAEAHHLDIKTALPQLIAGRPLDTADDPAAVISHRVERWTQQNTRRPQRHRPELIAGLISRAMHVTGPDMDRALAERDHALQTRANTVAQEAIADQAPWLRYLGPPPAVATARQAWTRSLVTIAAYRDHWHITDPNHPLGTDGAPIGPDQNREHHIAGNALTLAARLAQLGHRQPAIAVITGSAELTPELQRGIDL